MNFHNLKIKKAAVHAAVSGQTQGIRCIPGQSSRAPPDAADAENPVSGDSGAGPPVGHARSALRALVTAKKPGFAPSRGSRAGAERQESQARREILTVGSRPRHPRGTGNFRAPKQGNRSGGSANLS